MIAIRPAVGRGLVNFSRCLKQEEFPDSVSIDVRTPIREVQAFAKEKALEAGLSRSRTILAVTIVSDLTRSIRRWCGEGSGQLAIANDGTRTKGGKSGIQVMLTWAADMPQPPDWFACSDIERSTLESVLGVIHIWHNPPTDAGVFFRV